jgi:hypothetical protein
VSSCPMPRPDRVSYGRCAMSGSRALRRQPRIVRSNGTGSSTHRHDPARRHGSARVQVESYATARQTLYETRRPEPQPRPAAICRPPDMPNEHPARLSACGSTRRTFPRASMTAMQHVCTHIWVRTPRNATHSPPPGLGHDTDQPQVASSSLCTIRATTNRRGRYQPGVGLLVEGAGGEKCRNAQ